MLAVIRREFSEIWHAQMVSTGVLFVFDFVAVVHLISSVCPSGLRGVDSSSTVFALVGSNPTADKTTSPEDRDSP